jgi:chromosomal replication initiator protein
MASDEYRVSIDNIQRLICREFGLTLAQLKSKNNSHKIAYPRQIAMYLAKHLTRSSLPQIGSAFGGKHHTTVLHSVNKITEMMKTDRDLNRLINKLSDSLN